MRVVCQSRTAASAGRVTLLPLSFPSTSVMLCVGRSVCVSDGREHGDTGIEDTEDSWTIGYRGRDDVRRERNGRRAININIITIIIMT